MLFLNHDLSKEEQDQASATLYQEWESIAKRSSADLSLLDIGMMRNVLLSKTPSFGLELIP